MKSILSQEKRCYLCGSTVNVEEHHIYFGPRRKASTKNGFTCYLCAYHHRDSRNGVHGNRNIDLILKRACQYEYEKTHSREEFMEIIGRNYL